MNAYKKTREKHGGARPCCVVCGEVTVSYTHLAVYKRQICTQGKRKGRRISPRVPRWYRSIDPDGSIKDGTYGRRTSGYRTPMEDSEQTDSGFLVYGRELCDRDSNTRNNKPDPARDHLYERCRLCYDQTSFRTMLILSRPANRRECMGRCV